MNVGAQSANNPLFAGSALKQTGAFSTTSLNANMVLYAAGICPAGTCGSTVPEITVGVMSIPSSGNFSLTGDQNNGGTLVSPFAFTGTYAVDSSGRTLLTRTGHVEPGIGIYLVGANQGFFASTGSDAVIGFAEPQSGGPFTTASVNGTFSFGTTDQTTEDVSDNSGVANFDGTGTVSGTSDDASLSSTPKTNTFSQPYSVTNGTGTPGRGTITQSGSTNLIFYVISTSKIVLMDASASNTSPAITIGEK